MDSTEIGKLTIPLFIGTILNWALLGSLLVQVYVYFQAFPNGGRFSKILVIGVIVAELLQMLGSSQDTIRSFGAGWGDPEVLDDIGWAWFSVPILGSTIASAGQIFFAWRIHILGRSLVIPALIVVVTAVQQGAGIWTGVEIVRAGRFSRLRFALLKPPVAWLAATALSDLIILAGIVFIIVKARQPGFRRSTDAVLSRIIQITVETGLLCAMFALIDLSLFIQYDGNNYHLAVCIWLSKVYSNSILVILNSRVHITHAPPPNGASRNRTSGIVFHSGGRGPSVQVAIETESRSTREDGSDSIPQSAADKDEVHALKNTRARPVSTGGLTC
ncbi:hypothetical protein B0H17DRAFT_1215121 [Mycena rosella]|uniref:DUF6534 domain-containing protein n=1 Tax=Mycena rosella TaxID=1033263 RepID=A0AAD7G3N1_MYCRO|nr:hypothetical protein B0H17DRAFT_1215121 [Mycena rosella]